MRRCTDFYPSFLLLCLGPLLSSLWSAVISHYRSHPRSILLVRAAAVQLYSRPLQCYGNSYAKTSNVKGDSETAKKLMSTSCSSTIRVMDHVQRSWEKKRHSRYTQVIPFLFLSSLQNIPGHKAGSCRSRILGQSLQRNSLRHRAIKQTGLLLQPKEDARFDS